MYVAVLLFQRLSQQQCVRTCELRHLTPRTFCGPSCRTREDVLQDPSEI